MGNSRHIFFIDNSEKVRIDTNGNVGIGTNNPSQKLDVNGSALVSSLYVKDTIFHDGDTDNRIDFGTDTISFSTAGTTALTVDSDSQVGIGTASPSTALEVNGAMKGGVNVSAKSADFTLSSTDNGDFIHGTSTSFDQISISSDLGANFNCTVIHPTKDVDIVASSSMIVNGTTNGTVTLASGFQPASIVRIASNSYAVFGNLL